MLSRRVIGILVGCVLIMPSRTIAQSNMGVWGGPYADFIYSSPIDACRAQWNGVGMNDGKSRFIGANETSNGNAACAWTSYQYLCNAEAGEACWTILPGSVFFQCPNGFVSYGNNRCVPEQEKIREQPPLCRNNGGNTNSTEGNPIAINSGAKIEYITDYKNVDSRFSVSRFYRSTPQVAEVAGWRSRPRGSANGWRFDFSMELHIGSNSNVTIYDPYGIAYNYNLSGNQFLPEIANSSDYKVELIGQAPDQWYTIRQRSWQWKITDNQDRVWLLQTYNIDANANNSGDYLVGRPISLTHRDGYALNFAYRSDEGLQSITDTFGRAFGITWRNFVVTTIPNKPGYLPVPDVVSEIATPDGGVLRYTYDPPPSSPSTSLAERLTRVERLNASGTLVSSITYHYEDSRFPNYLTGITDERGVRYATFTYDASGRTATSEHAGSNSKYVVAYSTDAGGFKATVTNPLGKQSFYTLNRGSNGADVNQTALNGLSSPNCAASVTSMTYDSNGFIASTIDEEGRKTTYVRDGLGRPTSITRGAP